MITNTTSPTPRPTLPLTIALDRESGRPEDYDMGFLRGTRLLLDATGYEVGAVRIAFAPSVVSAVNSHAEQAARIAELEGALVGMLTAWAAAKAGDVAAANWMNDAEAAARALLAKVEG